MAIRAVAQHILEKIDVTMLHLGFQICRKCKITDGYYRYFVSGKLWVLGLLRFVFDEIRCRLALVRDNYRHGFPHEHNAQLYNGRTMRGFEKTLRKQ